MTVVSQISIHQQHEFLAKLEAAGLTGQLAQRVIESRGNALARDIVALVHGQQPTFPSFSITVNYGRSVKRLIKDGLYNWALSDITGRHFPSTQKGKAQVEIYIASFGTISSEDAIKEMDRYGLRPATLKELLSLGASYPKQQVNNPIAALGSTWRYPDGSLSVPYLGWYDSDGRYLSLTWADSSWSDNWRFATVSK